MASTPEHALYCFDVLDAHLNGDREPFAAEFDDAKYPLFVTWNIRSSRSANGYRLRGCIGNFGALSLVEGLAEYALISALEDSRFSPVRIDELSKLQCGVSLLVDFEDAESYLDWEIGTHGIYITFTPPANPTSQEGLTSTLLGKASRSSRSSRPLTATYLPDVIPEQGWTKVEAVTSALRKAGYNGTVSEDVLQNHVKLRRYKSSKAHVNYDEFAEWKAARSNSGTPEGGSV